MTQDILKKHVEALFSRRFNCEFGLTFIGDVEFAYNEDLNFFLFYTEVPQTIDKRYHCIVTSGDGRGKIYVFDDIHYYDSNVIMAKGVSFDIYHIQDKFRRHMLALANEADGSLLTIVK